MGMDTIGIQSVLISGDGNTHPDEHTQSELAKSTGRKQQERLVPSVCPGSLLLLVGPTVAFLPPPPPPPPPALLPALLPGKWGKADKLHACVRASRGSLWYCCTSAEEEQQQQQQQQQQEEEEEKKEEEEEEEDEEGAEIMN
ncbi:unnamed protein product [Pleuronectes platessa]|uniref:Uncharacterized protein n=1 Tax=Pleuronectes platessa TaxID=8262 RepID=A0A9N7U574_PLEPL|nr:unnamed protein product [Pleuronectes platessa]